MLHEVVRANDVDAAVRREESSAAPGADEGIRGAADARAVDEARESGRAPHGMAAAPEIQAAVAAGACAMARACSDRGRRCIVGKSHTRGRVAALAAPLVHAGGGACVVQRRAQCNASAEATGDELGCRQAGYFPADNESVKCANRRKKTSRAADRGCSENRSSEALAPSWPWWLWPQAKQRPVPRTSTE